MISLKDGSPKDSSPKTLAFLIVTQVFYLIFSAVWLVVLGISAMMFDSPGSENNIGLNILYYYIQAYPGGFLLALCFGWFFFAKKKWRAAVLWNLIPLIWVIPFLGMIVYANFL
ncbi:hypothetical protein [Fontibacillus sp. BL9]|uniref:hypothetical protein n=1 Tax=Fontibacillus sp. BL9 TaxID=3389971 RepID=UPI0039793EF8